jgi:predicted dehydrogenase
MHRPGCAVVARVFGPAAFQKGDVDVSQENQGTTIARRDFIKTSALTTAAMAGGLLASGVWAQGDDKIRIGLIGCGGRGSGAAANACASAEGVELYAMGDLFQDRLDKSIEGLKEAIGDQFNATPERCFVGFDAYQKVLATDVNYVLLTTPPGFRPQHLRAAVEAGKNVFMEKPVAVCPTGVRHIIESGEMARQKGLGIMAGTQYRHHPCFLDLVKRVHDGQIGRIVAAQSYYNTGTLWKYDRKPEWSDIEWQVRNWLYFTWLAGDHIVEQAIHHIDTTNWFLNAWPVECVATGGRQVRTDPAFGHIYDHFAVDFVYPDGVKVTHMCRQMDNCEGRLGEVIIGTDGTCDGMGGFITGKNEYRSPEKPGFQGIGAAYVAEHGDLIKGLRAGEPVNEAEDVALTCLTGIMGRMAAYTGKKVTWDFVRTESQLNLMKDITAFGDLPVDEVAVPGRTPLV